MFIGVPLNCLVPQASRRGPATPRMASVLLQAILRVRFHRHSEVRQSLLFAVSKVFMVSAKFLPLDFVREIMGACTTTVGHALGQPVH